MRQKVLAVLLAIIVGITVAGCSEDISTIVEETELAASEDMPIVEQEGYIEDSVAIVEDDDIDSTVGSDTKEFKEKESIDGEAKGLILAGFFAFDDYSYIVFSINPVTGDYQEISRFPYDVNAWIGNVGDIVPAGIPEYRFSSDFTKMAAQMTVINTENDIHEIHAGWM